MFTPAKTIKACLTLLLFVVALTACQHNGPDKIALERVNQLVTQGNSLMQTDHVKAIAVLEQAKAAAIANNGNYKQLVWIYQTLGYLYQVTGQIGPAAENLTWVLHNTYDKHAQAFAYDNLSKICHKANSFNSALIYSQLAIDLYSSLNEQAVIPTLHHLRGICFISIGDYNEAVLSFEASKSGAEANEDKALIGKIYNSLGYLHTLKKDYTAAIGLYISAMEHTSNRKYIIQQKRNLAHVYQLVGDMTLAEDHFQQVLALETEHGILHERTQTCYNYAQLLQTTNRPAEAQAYLEKAVAASKGLLLTEAAGLAHTELATLYETQNKPAAALAVSQQYSTLLAHKAALTEELQAQNTQLELALQRQINETKIAERLAYKRLYHGLAFAAIVATAVVLVVLSFLRRQRRAAIEAVGQVYSGTDYQEARLRRVLLRHITWPWRKFKDE